MSHNTTKHNYRITKANRETQSGHNASLIWFTGLSGSGKSTLANLVEVEWFNKGVHTYVLDGDNIRNGINRDLSFSPEDRKENIRRIAEVGNLFLDAGIITLAAFVSPYRADRDNIKALVGSDNFIEIYVNTSLEECERRDVKGLYKKARSGEIQNMTGISAPYEAPLKPDLEIATDNKTVEASVQIIMDFLEDKI